MKKLILFAVLLLLSSNPFAQKKDSKAPDSLKNVSLSGLSFRSIGPAITGGRVIDIAVNPNNHSEYFIAAGSGSLFKTINNGITFTPVFDNQNSYAIGAVEIDPSNTNIIWVGTGENRNQNNVAYGDGVYKSEDCGKSWKNMGIKNSEHIGGIVIDPENSDIVYAAAMGPLRREGGDRGVYKTTDGGKTWNKTLYISEYTGINEIYIDPMHSNVLYAVAQQRMRKLYTGISGGPESGIYKSIDHGVTWEKLSKGLPSEDVGRIGLSVSHANPDILYAIIEAKKEQGVYRSVDRGASWTKQNSYVSAYPFYFQKLVADPKDQDKVYSLDIFNKISRDGGKTWTNLGEKSKHVDNHALWINPDNTNHLISGCDGGVYETYDMGKNWDFKSNLPIAEVYKITTDNALPFYNVYIGTQDNNSLGGPSRTINSGGITNQDWTFTLGGDGFQSQVDWKDPNIVYAQSQNGGLTRYDKRTGESLFIKPYDFSDTAYRFDWDAALLISKHDNKRLYFGGNKLFRSDDQGSTWDEISPDLTRGIPKNFQKLMGRSWSIDELASKSSMAQISTIAESPINENMLYVGSGDGLLSYTIDGGKTWNKANTPKLPEYSRVHKIIASSFNQMVAYAACHNFHDGDYKPYLLKTTDGGKNWFFINSNLPERGSTYTVAEDHVDQNLLFVGTQFGVYFTNNGGEEWMPLKNGMPSISVMDLTIQRPENDLVVSTFGRGVYILDDYTPLRHLSKEMLHKDASIFPIKEGKMFIPASPFGYSGNGFMGASFFSAPNPEMGVAFTYYIKDKPKSLKELRRETEKEIQKKGEELVYPDYTTVMKESEEQDPFLLFIISDEQGNVIRKIKKEISKGINRVTWDFRYNIFSPISLDPVDTSIPWNEPDKGYMVVPGKYKVSLMKYQDGKFTELAAPQEFECKPLNEFVLSLQDKKELNLFNRRVAELTRAISGADAYRKELAGKISYFKKAVFETGTIPAETYNQILAIDLKLAELNRKLNGDPLRSKYEGSSPTSVKDRVDLITSALWSTTSAPTTTFIKSYEAAADKFSNLSDSLKKIDQEIKAVELTLEKYGAPYTPGRFPEWKKEL